MVKIVLPSGGGQLREVTGTKLLTEDGSEITDVERIEIDWSGGDLATAKITVPVQILDPDAK